MLTVTLNIMVQGCKCISKHFLIYLINSQNWIQLGVDRLLNNNDWRDWRDLIFQRRISRDSLKFFYLFLIIPKLLGSLIYILSNWLRSIYCWFYWLLLWFSLPLESSLRSSNFIWSLLCLEFLFSPELFSPSSSVSPFP